MRPIAASTLCAAAMLAACGGEDSSSSSNTSWIDDVLQETEGAPPVEWIEVPLADNVFVSPQAGYRSDVIEIEVPEFGQGIEYKLAMQEGDAITYTWRVRDVDNPALFQSEFHGHTERVGDAPGTVMFYRKAVGLEEEGALVAPFDGIHGWYLVNQTEEPVIVELTVSGFYELVPDQ